VKKRAKRAQELPEGSGLIFGFQVSNMDCLPEVFPWFFGSFQGLLVFPGTCLDFLGTFRAKVAHELPEGSGYL
jgi:hypothetical protein